MDEELVDKVAGAIWDATPTQCEMTWQEAKKMSAEIKWESTIIQHINMAKAALSTIHRHKTQPDIEGIREALESALTAMEKVYDVSESGHIVMDAIQQAKQALDQLKEGR